MRSRILLSAVAAVAATVHGAQAQQAPTTPAPRVLAQYAFTTTPRHSAFPVTITVADSAGSFVASARIPGSPAATPMTVTVLDSNLVLQGATPDGVLTLVLDRQNEGGITPLTSGRWSLGYAEGSLRSRG